MAVTVAAPTKAPTKSSAPPAPKTESRHSVATPRSASPPRTPLFLSTPSTGNPHTGGGGIPLAAPVQSAIENSFGVDLDSVRVHNDSNAHLAARDVSARAFTYGNHIFLGQGERPTDLRLMAHEAAHVVQQQGARGVQTWTSSHSVDAYEHEAHSASAAVVSGQSFAVKERTGGPKILRSLTSFAEGIVSGAKDVVSGAVDVVKSAVDIVGKVINWFADKAYIIPGFRMFTIVLGFNPINMSKADNSTANICRAAVELMPGGALISQALDKYSVFDKVGTWVDQQIKTLGMVAGTFKKAIDDFIHGFSVDDLWPPDTLWEKAKSIFTVPVNRLLDFIKSLAAGVIKFIKDAILKPLAALASKTDGWDLLCAVLGKNPITDEEVPRTAENILPAVLKLAGEQEVWENIKKANAIARVTAWFKGALNGLLAFVKQVPSMLKQAVTDLEIEDIILLPKAIIKIGKAFLGFLGKFGSWAGEQVWALLEIIFDVLIPSAMPYLKKVGAAIKSIFKNPMGFVGNLVNAAKLGFQNFGANFLEHLKAGLIDWLTGSLPGIYIPKAFSLGEIAKFAFSVLGLSWANIRQKLVKATSETVVKTLETTFDIVVTLVKDGPAAAWEKIKEQLSNLKDMVIGGITDFVVDMVVKKAIPKLIAMFIPGAGFISAILSIYDTIMVFVNKIKQIIAVVTGFIDSMVAIANGVIAAAASRVESTLAGLLSLAINFLAGFAGLGKVADKIMGVIEKIRAPIDKALDWLVNWIVNAAKKIGKFLLGESSGSPGDVQAAAQQAVRTRLGGNATLARAQAVLPAVIQELQPKGLKSLTLGPPNADGEVEILAEASPKKRIAQLVHKKVIVAVSAKVQVRGEPVLSGLLRGPQAERQPGGGLTIWPAETLRFAEFHEEQKAALGGTGRAATLPPVSQPPRTAARKGDQPSAGLIVEPEAGSRQIEVLAWNTSQPNKGHNTSHAERQFVEWFSARPFAWRKRVVSVTVDVQGRPVCELCHGDLEKLRSSHSWASFSWTGASASASDGEVLAVQ